MLILSLPLMLKKDLCRKNWTVFDKKTQICVKPYAHSAKRLQSLKQKPKKSTSQTPKNTLVVSEPNQGSNRRLSPSSGIKTEN